MVRVGLLGQWWRRGSAESERRLKVSHVDNVQRKFKNQDQALNKLAVGRYLKWRDAKNDDKSVQI